ncbi:ketosteroid isomerase-like protein [Rhodoblastus acidophilus]|uniref:nuclear transport factor 2 family protein n=1 Tax=Rhodoblastus acidophilus TaxID=1074 RepID=UPI0022247CD6|nr:ketosteroid isomerase-like protein [Rhodoblastus acidophilus]
MFAWTENDCFKTLNLIRGSGASMQSLQNLAQLASVDRELFETRIHYMLDLCSQGNIDGIIGYFSEDVSYQMIGNWSMFPYAGPVRGKPAVKLAFAGIFTHFQSLGSTVHDIVIDGDRVAVRRTTILRHFGTGRSDGVAVVDFVRFRDGLVAELTEVLDSLAIARLEEG